MNWAALVLLLSLLSCAGGDPFSSGVASAVPPIQRTSPPAFDRLGCTEIRISLTFRGDDYRAESDTADRWCGPVAVSLDSVRVEPAPSGFALKLELTLRNHSGLMFDNVHVLAWDDSVSINGGAEDSSHKVRWNDSSSIVHILPERPGAPPSAAWRYGQISAAVEESSGPYPIHLEVLTTARDALSFMLIMHVAGELVPGQVPPRAPSYIPQDLFSNLDPLWGIPPDLIAIIFRSGTTYEERVAAINAVNGTVIGGVAYKGMPIEGAYYIRIPSNGVYESLLPALRVLDTRSSILSASMVVPAVPAGLTPDDGEGWQ